MTRAQRTPEFWRDANCLFLLVVFLSLLLASRATIKHMIYTYDPLNFHVVKDGVMYRSAQPTGHGLRMVAEEHGIKSVINLRGVQPGEDWYDEELAVSQEMGLELVGIRMPAARLPHGEDLLRLLEAYRDLPRPFPGSAPRQGLFHARGVSGGGVSSGVVRYLSRKLQVLRQGNVLRDDRKTVLVQNR